MVWRTRRRGGNIYVFLAAHRHAANASSGPRDCAEAGAEGGLLLERLAMHADIGNVRQQCEAIVCHRFLFRDPVKKEKSVETGMCMFLGKSVSKSRHAGSVLFRGATVSSNAKICCTRGDKCC